MLKYNKYGKKPYTVYLLHGGPGACGEMKPVAKQLSKYFGVIESIQTKYSIDDLIQELYLTIVKNSDKPVVLVGYSWGAWLAIIFTNRYPDLISKLILISSGPFEEKYVEVMDKVLKERISDKDKLILSKLEKNLKNSKDNKEKTFKEFGNIFNKIDSYKPINRKKTDMKLDPEMYNSIWKEASNMRKKGEFPNLLKNISTPITAIHGDYDRHPYIGVKEPLKKYCKNSKFILLNKCGHTPWKEKYAKDSFYKELVKAINKL